MNQQEDDGFDLAEYGGLEEEEWQGRIKRENNFWLGFQIFLSVAVFALIGLVWIVSSLIGWLFGEGSQPDDAYQVVHNDHPEECDELRRHEQHNSLLCVFLDLPINQTSTLSVVEESTYNLDTLLTASKLRNRSAPYSYIQDCKSVTPSPVKVSDTPIETKKAPCGVRNLATAEYYTDSLRIAWDRPGYTDPRTRCQPETDNNNIRYGFVIQVFGTDELLPLTSHNLVESADNRVTVTATGLTPGENYLLSVAAYSEECNLWSLPSHMLTATPYDQQQS